MEGQTHGSADRVLRIVYRIGVHKNPEQVSRLVERIYCPSDFFYINIFMTKETPPHSEWESALQKYRNGNMLYTWKRGGAWGGFGNVEGPLDAMTYCRGFDYDYFINLSGQCYPIKPMDVIKEELRKRNVAYMENFRLPSKAWEGENGGLDRINCFHVRLLNLSIRIPRLNKALPYGLEPYGGSYWFCLPKRFVDYVLDYVSNHPAIMRFYRHCRIPEEMFFQTIIMNSPLKSDVVNDDKRYIRWQKKPSPEILTQEDFNEIMRSDKLFARKFDINVDKTILDLIDREIEQPRQVASSSAGLSFR